MVLTSPVSAALRSWQTSDADALLAAWHDPDIARWNEVPASPSFAQALQWIEGDADRFARRLSVDMVIDSPQHGGVVGEVGLTGFSDAHRGALIGYWLLPSARGFGLASAAVHAFTDWAHQSFGVDIVVARCHPENQPSQLVAERAGYVLHSTDSNGNRLWRHRRPPTL